MIATLSEAEMTDLKQGIAGAEVQRRAVSVVASLLESVAVERAAARVESPEGAVARLQAIETIARLDQDRLIVRLLDVEKRTQVEVAAMFGVPQPAIHGRAKAARTLPAPRPGFSGASPMELCQRHAAGLLTRAELVDELTRWTYPAEPERDPWDDLLMRPEGGWAEVEQAVDRGLIDGELYDEVLDATADSGTSAG